MSLRFPALALLGLLIGGRAAAQSPEPYSRRAEADMAGQLAAMSANAALSGLSAGLVQKLRGGSFQDGFARGALGGGVAFLGKRLTVERFRGAGLAGRQVAALGNSVVGNAAVGRGSFDRLVFPVGITRLYVQKGEGPRLRLRVDLHGLIWTAYAAATPELRLDAAASLSAGAPVFRSPGYMLSWKNAEDEYAGFAPAGIILLSDNDRRYGESAAIDPVTFAHERVHVIQFDQMFAAWSDPLQQWILPHLPGGRAVGRFVDFDLASPLVYGVTFWHDGYEGRPWEREAYYLAEQ